MTGTAPVSIQIIPQWRLSTPVPKEEQSQLPSNSRVLTSSAFPHWQSASPVSQLLVRPIIKVWCGLDGVILEVIAGKMQLSLFAEYRSGRDDSWCPPGSAGVGLGYSAAAAVQKVNKASGGWRRCPWQSAYLPTLVDWLGCRLAGQKP